MRHLLLLLPIAIAGACDAPVATPDAGVDGSIADAGTDAGLPCRAPYSVSVHDGCRCSDECAGDATCLPESSQGAPGGECVPGCTSDADCSGGPCILGDAGVGVCRVECAASDACRDGWRCVAGICSPWCDDDGQCESGHCNPHTHWCDGGPPREGADTGEPCRNDDDCLSGRCDDENLGGRCTTLCTSEVASCPPGSACVFGDATTTFGICLPSCEALDDCGEGLDCVQVAFPPSLRACLPEPAGTDCLGRETVIVDGGPCGCPSDCSYGFECVQEWLSDAPYGVCVRPCDAMGMTVTDDPACGEGLLCHDWIDVSSSEGGGACFPRCDTTTDCPRGRICSASEGCVPFCQADAECESGLCDRYRGECEANTATAGGIGAPCDRYNDCLSRECRESATAGFCTAYCDVDRQLCPDDAVCVEVGDGSRGLCMPACTGDADCAAIAGATCMPASAPGLRRHCDLAGAD